MAAPSEEDQQKIVQEFQRMRESQKDIAEEITKIEEERREHRRVIELLEELDGEDKCFRLHSDSLVEHSVKEVLPQLKDHLEKLGVVVDTLNGHLVSRGKELNDYRTKHSIRLLTEQETLEFRKNMAKAQVEGQKEKDGATPATGDSEKK